MMTASRPFGEVISIQIIRLVSWSQREEDDDKYDMTQEELARLVCVRRETIGNLESAILKKGGIIRRWY